MQPLTFSTNKHFIPIANKPLIFYPIEAVAEAGIKDIAITYNSGWYEKVKNFLGTGSKWGVKFTYVLQEKPLGLANIFQVCEEYFAGDSFVFHLGDNIFTEGIKRYADYFLREKPNGLVTMVKHPENWRLGVPYFDKRGRLVRYVEKPKRPPHKFAIPGVYFFDSNVFKCFRGKDRIKPSQRGEYEIAFPYQWLIDHGYRVDVLEYQGRWLDPGKFDDWIEANQYLLDHNGEGKIQSKLDRASSIQGRVGVGKRCRIRNSKIRGPVVIGDNVVIKNSYIGPYTSIANDCEIERSNVENSVLMQGVRIVKVKQPIDNSLIGAQAEISDTKGHSNCLELLIGEKSRVKI